MSEGKGDAYVKGDPRSTCRKGHPILPGEPRCIVCGLPAVSTDEEVGDLCGHGHLISEGSGTCGAVEARAQLRSRRVPIIIVSIVTAAAALGLVMALALSSGGGSNRSANFIDALHRDIPATIHFDSGTLIDNAHIMCDNLNDAELAEYKQFEQFVKAGDGLNAVQEGQIMIVSGDYYCPDDFKWVIGNRAPVTPSFLIGHNRSYDWDLGRTWGAFLGQDAPVDWPEPLNMSADFSLEQGDAQLQQECDYVGSIQSGSLNEGNFDAGCYSGMNIVMYNVKRTGNDAGVTTTTTVTANTDPGTSANTDPVCGAPGEVYEPSVGECSEPTSGDIGNTSTSNSGYEPCPPGQTFKVDVQSCEPNS